MVDRGLVQWIIVNGTQPSVFQIVAFFVNLLWTKLNPTCPLRSSSLIVPFQVSIVPLQADEQVVREVAGDAQLLKKVDTVTTTTVTWTPRTLTRFEKWIFWTSNPTHARLFLLRDMSMSNDDGNNQNLLIGKIKINSWTGTHYQIIMHNIRKTKIRNIWKSCFQCHRQWEEASRNWEETWLQLINSRLKNDIWLISFPGHHHNSLQMSCSWCRWTVSPQLSALWGELESWRQKAFL